MLVQEAVQYIKMPYLEVEISLVFQQLGYLVLEAYRKEMNFSQTVSMRLG